MAGEDPRQPILESEVIMPFNSQSLAAQREAAATYGASSEPYVIVYPNKDGTTGGNHPNLTAPSFDSSDPYAGTPLNINVGNSAAGLQSLSGTLSSGFEGLFDLISKNTDKNNAWSAAQAQKQMDFQRDMQNIAMEYNSLEAAKNRDWQEMMSNTAHQREVADLKAAGLNPILSASGGNGAAVTSGATAAGAGVPSGSKADADLSGNSALAAIYGALINAQTQMANANLSARTNMYIADKQVEASMYGAQMAANASMFGSQMAYNASTYGSDQNLLNNREQRDWNSEHPQTIYQDLVNQRGNSSNPVTGFVNRVADFADSIFGGLNKTISSGKAKAKSGKF